MRICSIPECKKKHAAHGYCWSHFGRFKRHGDPLVVKREFVRRSPFCTKEGCEDKHYAVGLCEKHYLESEIRRKNVQKYNRSERARSARLRHGATEKRRDTFLKSRYGISLSEFNAMLETQGGGCGICHSKTAGRKGTFIVDHCHSTGKIRGILCHKCNAGLGMFKDSREFLTSASDYLEKNGH